MPLQVVHSYIFISWMDFDNTVMANWLVAIFHGGKMMIKQPINRVFIRHRILESSLATKQNSLAKFCLFLERALPFHNNPPVTLQYSPATPILNENPA